MVLLSTFIRLILIMNLVYSNASPNETLLKSSSKNNDWNYVKHGTDWGGTCATGKQQSPIKIRRFTALSWPMPALEFRQYKVPILKELILKNNGRSVSLEVPITQKGRPYIRGGPLIGKYEAISLHFHWGSENTTGAEHVIDGTRYDVEMHIVHRNKKYSTTQEATNYSDGLAVLAIMLEEVEVPDRIYPGLNRLINQITNIVDYEAETVVPGPLTLQHFAGDVNLNEFFTYQGSLTTVDCAEAVTWIVFPQPLPFSREQISKFWQIRDENYDLLLNTYRAPQPRNNRIVYYNLI